MAEVSKICFHFANKVEEALEINLDEPAPLMGEGDKENEVHLIFGKENMQNLYDTFMNYYEDLESRMKQNDVEKEVQQG